MKTKHILIEIMPRAIWVIEGLTLFLLHKIFGREPVLNEKYELIVLGTIIALSGIVFLISTFRYVSKAMFTKDLITSGPYKFARHPMYVSMYIVLIGIGIVYFSWLWFLILFAFVPIWVVDCYLEEAQMTDLWGGKYVEYSKKVGLFFPKFI
jgi:protein-S-isoprenylcysteine O-methyltransferase Ste14